MKLDRPVIVTGPPRSGKTCVSHVLRPAREFVVVSEPLMIWDAGLRCGPSDRRAADAATELVKRRIISRCERLVRAARKERYLDNLSYHAVRLPFVLAVMPEVRLIYVLRDPHAAIPEMIFGWRCRDSFRKAIRRRGEHVDLTALLRLVQQFVRNYVRSRTAGWRATWGPRVPGLEEMVRRGGLAMIAAYQWRRIVEIAAADLLAIPPVQTLEVRYERLVTDPRGEAGRIADFAGVRDRQAVVDFAARYLQEDYVHDEPCRIEPEPAEWEAIDAIVGELRARLGYRGVGVGAGGVQSIQDMRERPVGV